MKASELRHGNKVYNRAGKVLTIDRFYGDKIECDVRGLPDKDDSTGIPLHYHPYTEDIEHCKPIPLTKEWLFRFGFTISRTQAHKKYNNFGDQVTLNKIGEEFELVYLATTIKYVHQLQNLYFALTGEELEV